jgi:hypothetical protein
MPITRHTRALCALATLALGAPIAAAQATPSTRSVDATAPTVTVTMSGKRLAIAGPTHWRPGAVRISAVSRGGEQELTLLQFRADYTYARFVADGARANGQNAGAAAAMRRVFAETDFLGGADVFPGTPAAFTVDLAPGTYYLGAMNAHPVFRRIVVAGTPLPAATKSDALVTAYDFGFRTSTKTLPAHGTITIRNTGRQIHRVVFETVKTGTTRAQIGAYLRKTGGRPYGPPPSFARQGPDLGTAMISPGRQIELSYSLPAGEYALLCFQRDNRTGKPQALEGMYGVTTLR